MKKSNLNLVLSLLFTCIFLYPVTAQSVIKDSDGNTRVDTEKFPGDDKVHIDLKGTTRFILDQNNNGDPVINVLSPSWNVFIGLTGWTNLGAGNTALGSQTLGSNTSGSFNTATGRLALGYNSTGHNNSAFGVNALQKNTIGFSNTAVGNNALFSNTTKSNLVAIGDSALYNNGTGANWFWEAVNNTAVGSKALFTNTIGSDNTAIGRNALYSNTYGYHNNALGFKALYSNTSGYNNNAIGYSALTKNTTGNNNVAIGWSALKENTTGTINTAIGTNALGNNITGSDNIAIGHSSMLNGGTNSIAIGNYANYNGTGGGNGIESIAMGTRAMYNQGSNAMNIGIGARVLYNGRGIGNIVMGNDALYNGSGSSTWNIGIGHNSLYNAAYGTANVCVGSYTGNAITQGDYNTFVGDRAGEYFTTGVSNTSIGNNAGIDFQSSGALTNTITLGASARAIASYHARIGNSWMTSIGGYTNWSNLSDGRYKNNVKENVPGMDFIRELRPITYTLDVKSINARLSIPDSLQDRLGIAQKEKYITSGFIAQEVEKSAQKIGYQFSGVDAPLDSQGMYGLRYAEFVVPIVKALQELDIENKTLQAQNVDLKTQNETILQQNALILKRLETLESATASRAATQNETLAAPAALKQNVPNPFDQVTIITATLPQEARTASLLVMSESGAQIKMISIAERGEVSIRIDAGTLSSGIYFYTLVIDGQQVETRKMVLVK